MRTINKIVIHCADTKPLEKFGRSDLYQWHVIENGWDNIGYHYFITCDGKLHTARPESEIGSHVKGHNKDSIGIMLFGGKPLSKTDNTRFTNIEFITLASLLKELRVKYPQAVIKGHYNYDKGKTCPNFDVQEWLNKENII